MYYFNTLKNMTLDIIPNELIKGNSCISRFDTTGEKPSVQVLKLKVVSDLVGVWNSTGHLLLRVIGSVQ